MKIAGWLCVVSTLSSVQVSAAWRSNLYPENWLPPGTNKAFYTDAFLQDFSYAGYKRGEAAIPNVVGPIYDVTTYGADSSGITNSTAHIQSAIDAASAAGGGVVYMPAGTYKVAPVGANTYALRITTGDIVLRGAGVGQTFIVNTNYLMRSKKIISVAPTVSGGSWVAITADLNGPTRRIPVADASGFSVGDRVLMDWDFTQAWIDEHNQGTWWSETNAPANAEYIREVTAVDTGAGWIEIDIPTRYTMKVRDSARVQRYNGMVSGVGFEDFSIANVQHPGTGFLENDYAVTNTVGYDVHNSWLIEVRNAVDSWIRNVHSFLPAGNTRTCHLLSNGIALNDCTRITVQDCYLQRPQYGGGGGNGYIYRIQNSYENLIIGSTAEYCRHGFVISHGGTSGNVFRNCVDIETGRATGTGAGYTTAGSGSDHHMHFSHSNLYDGSHASNSYWTAHHRLTSGTIYHALTSAHSTYWNIRGSGTRYTAIVNSEQGRYGYVIGTSGSKSGATNPTGGNTAPADILEGIGIGDTLYPQSLYLDQLAKRMQGVLVDAGGDMMLPVTNAAVSLSGSVYSYGHETPSSVWSQVSGPLAPIADSNALSTTVAILAPGTYTFRLTAFDAAATNQDEVVVDVMENIATLASKDYIVGESDGPALAYYADGASSMIGAGGAVNSRTDQVVILGYALPTLPVGTTVTGAVFHFEITTARDSSGADPALHVYLLDTSNPDGTGTSLFYHGASNNTVDAKFAGQTYYAVDGTEKTFADDEYDVSFTLSGDALTLLESFYGGDHIPDQPEAFFRFNLSVDPTVLPSTQYNRYRVDLADDESWLQIQPSEAPGAIPWSVMATVGITTTGAVATAMVNTNLTGLWLVWDTADRGGISTNHWPADNRVSLGPQSAGLVTGALSSLVADSQYVWRFYGETATTNGWTTAQDFSTALSAAQTPVFTNAVALSGTSLHLQWQDQADHETGYILRRSTNAISGFADLATLAANSTAYTDTGLADSTTYYYQVAATNSGNGSVTAFSLCQTNVTTYTLVVGNLVSRDYILGRSQTSDPPLGYNVEVISGQLGVGGSTGARYDRVPVFGFALPTLPVGTTISNATLNFEITGVRDDSGRDPYLHVYILSTSNPDGSGTNLFYHGPINNTAEAIFIDSTFIDSPTGVSTSFADDEHDQAYSLSGAALTLLQGLYGGDHIPEQQEVFFRFNHSLVPLAINDAKAYDRYFVDTALDESSLLITPTIPASDDTDNDGIPDDWELEHFGSLTNSAGLAGDDFDGDGFSDLHEYLAGTNPTNALSRLSLTSGAMGLSTNEFVLSWSAVSGKTYRIIGTTNLLDGSWMTNAAGISGVEPVNVHTVNTVEAGIFYRIELELP